MTKPPFCAIIENNPMFNMDDIQLKSLRRNSLPKVTVTDKYVSAAFLFLTVVTVFIISLRLIVHI